MPTHPVCRPEYDRSKKPRHDPCHESVGYCSNKQDFDTALASHPWRPLTASGHITSHSTTTSSFILKHAPHPSRPGYIVLLTDLSSVYLEELTAPGVPSRLREVARLPPLAKAANGKGKKQEVEDEEDMDDIVKQSEAALKRVQGLCAALTGREGEGEEGEVQASVEAGDYHVGHQHPLH